MAKPFSRSGPGLFALVFSCVVGCGKSPDALCKQIEAIDKANGDPSRSKEDCIKDFTKIKEKAPKGYACIAKVTDGYEKNKDEKAFLEAFKKCAGDDKELGGVLEEQVGRDSARREEEEADKVTSCSKRKYKELSISLDGRKLEITLGVGRNESRRMTWTLAHRIVRIALSVKCRSSWRMSNVGLTTLPMAIQLPPQRSSESTQRARARQRCRRREHARKPLEAPHAYRRL